MERPEGLIVYQLPEEAKEILQQVKDQIEAVPVKRSQIGSYFIANDKPVLYAAVESFMKSFSTDHVLGQRVDTYLIKPSRPCHS